MKRDLAGHFDREAVQVISRAHPIPDLTKQPQLTISGQGRVSQITFKTASWAEQEALLAACFLFLNHHIRHFPPSPMSTTPNRDQRLLSIGQQCSDPHCLLVDFLPFKCQHCAQSFCGDHFKVEAHKCPKYDESKHNRVAPSCTSYHWP